MFFPYLTTENQILTQIKSSDEKTPIRRASRVHVCASS